MFAKYGWFIETDYYCQNALARTSFRIVRIVILLTPKIRWEISMSFIAMSGFCFYLIPFFPAIRCLFENR